MCHTFRGLAYTARPNALSTLSSTPPTCHERRVGDAKWVWAFQQLTDLAYVWATASDQTPNAPATLLPANLTRIINDNSTVAGSGAPNSIEYYTSTLTKVLQVHCLSQSCATDVSREAWGRKGVAVCSIDHLEVLGEGERFQGEGVPQDCVPVCVHAYAHVHAFACVRCLCMGVWLCMLCCPCTTPWKAWE